MLRFALYPSSHGYGHASRIAALADAFHQIGIYTYICTDRPSHLFKGLSNEFTTLRNVKLDNGVIHGANLSVEVELTKQSLINLMNSRKHIVEGEIDFLRTNCIDLVILDIPFIVIEACKTIGIPVFGISNFDWLFIYNDLFGSDKQLTPLLNVIHSLYRMLDRSYLLPFGSLRSVTSFNNPTQLGLLARSMKNVETDKEILGIPLNMKTILVMFGGEGSLDLDWESLCTGFNGFVLSSNSSVNARNHMYIEKESDYLSIISAVDFVLCKPGYSSLAEIVQCGKPLLIIPRKDYPEEEVLLSGLSSYESFYIIDDPMMSSDQWSKIFDEVKPNPMNWDNCNMGIAGRILSDYFLHAYPFDRILSVIDVGSNNLGYLIYNKSMEEKLHTMWFTTALGRDISNGLISREVIQNIQSGLNDFLLIDSMIENEKYLLATGVSREAVNTDDVLSWFQSEWSYKTKVISARQEITHAWNAASCIHQDRKGYVVFDIGGFSIDIGWIDERERYHFKSIDLGLLKIDSLAERGIDYEKELISQLKDLHSPSKMKLIGVGLTITFLIQKLAMFGIDQNYSSDSTQKITIECLNSLHHSQFNINLTVAHEAKMMGYSIEIIKLLLDKFHAKEILVCEDGISVGFAKSKL